MQTSLSQQISAIQQARTIVAASNHPKLPPDIKELIDKGLNDAASTIAALKFSSTQFEGTGFISGKHNPVEIAMNFFQELTNSK